MNRYHSTVNAIRFPRRFLLSLAVSLAVSSVAPTAGAQAPTNVPSLPSLGDTSREALSPVIERKLGEEIMRDIRRDRDFLDDGPILEYLNTFGNALVAARPDARGEANFDYYFFAVRDPNLNAFALPGGFIAVHSALLLAAQSESELASVLGHEIGHVAQRHIARSIGQQKQDALIPLAAMILAALASRAGGDAAMGVFMGGQGLAIQRQLNFGRDAEREADRIGFQIMGQAGYETNGMVAFFQRLPNMQKQFSVMAGIRSDAIAAAIGSERVVRAMPNTPALIGQGIAGLYARPAVSAEERREAERLLAPTGRTLWVDNEVDLDAVTALSGSGPAYVFYFVEAMVQAAEDMGLTAEQGKQLALATFSGAAALAQASPDSPAVLRERVTSKGGTTYAALTSLDASGVKAAFVKALKAAQRRANELGNEFG